MYPSPALRIDSEGQVALKSCFSSSVRFVHGSLGHAVKVKNLGGDSGQLLIKESRGRSAIGLRQSFSGSLGNFFLLAAGGREDIPGLVASACRGLYPQTTCGAPAVSGCLYLTLNLDIFALPLQFQNLSKEYS